MTPMQIAQGIGIVLTALGLSAAPWIVALLRGGLLTRKAHEDRVADLKEQRDKAEERASVADTRADNERGRADDANAKLGVLAGEFGATTVHLLKSLPSVEEAPHGQ